MGKDTDSEGTNVDYNRKPTWNELKEQINALRKQRTETRALLAEAVELLRKSNGRFISPNGIDEFLALPAIAQIGSETKGATE